MKLIAIASLVIAASAVATQGYSRISSLKKAVEKSSSKSAFGLSGFEDKKNGRLSVQLNLEPQLFQLTQELQENSWKALESDSPMKGMGFSQWKSAKGGLAFRDEKGMQSECLAAAGENPEPNSLVVHFNCKSVDNVAMRLAEVRAPVVPAKTAIVTPKPITGPATYATAVAPPGGYPAADSAGSVWQPSSNGRVPFGWATQWGEWDYPYYTVTTQGILGCRTTENSYCTPQSADMFPFTPTFDWSNYLRADSPALQRLHN